MIIAEAFLLVFATLGIGLSPFYLYLRSKMTRSNKPHEYSKKTIFRVAGMHFCMMFTATAIQVIILQSLLNGSQLLTQRAIFVVSIQVLFLAAALYGSGIYITAILFETFVTRKYLVIRFLHGPLSHTIIYTSYLGTFANLGFIAAALNTHTTIALWPILFIYGVVTGVVVAIDNYANGILLISLIVSSIALGVFIFLNSGVNSFTYFFVGIDSGLLVMGGLLAVTRIIQGKRLSWYDPINIFGAPHLVKGR